MRRMKGMRATLPWRKADITAAAIIVGTMLQLAVGGVAVILFANMPAAAQSQDVLNARADDHLQALDQRVAEITRTLERLNIEPRLTALETSVGLSVKLAMGIMVTLIGLLAAQLVQIRDGRRRREEPMVHLSDGDDA
jgi:hypothetical protein